MNILIVYFTLLFIPMKRAEQEKSNRPPRMRLDFFLPPSQLLAREVQKPTLQNIQAGKLVMFEGYHAGVTIMAITNGITAAKKFDHLNPMSSYFYTDVYRWTLRYLDLFPEWLTKAKGHYTDTHKVWRKRYFYMDKFVPHWLRSIINLFIDKKQWRKEEKEFKQFMKYAEPSFGNHYFYPSKVFNNFKSQDTGLGTIENLDSSDMSIHETINNPPSTTTTTPTPNPPEDWEG